MGVLSLNPGDWIIYRKQKVSSSPGPRAQQTMPASNGETYHYVVEKYWIVDELLNDGRVRLRTRRGKVHDIAVNDPRLRKARWWERLFLSSRFRAVEASPAPDHNEAGDGDS